MQTPVTTIKAAHQAIEAHLRGHFGANVEQFGVYQPWDPIDDEPEATLRTPALLIELAAMPTDEPEDHSPGRVAIRCQWTIHVVLSILTENLQVALAELSAAVIALIRQTEIDPFRPPLNGNRWGLGDAVGPPEAVFAEPAEFDPGLHGRDSWAVSWEQVIYVAESLPTD